MSEASATVPEEGTVERWAWDYVVSESLAYKLAPPPPPERWEATPTSRRLDVPGRPPELVIATKRTKTPKPAALVRPDKRAELLHVFFHHELQAAELLLRAALLFAEEDLAFRRGLVRIARDEIRHMALYVAHLAKLGYAVGDFPVRDWFWERVPSAKDAASFVALLGVGFEGANLDHTRRFAQAFRDAGDEEGAALQDRVGDEEIAHVRFAATWLERFTGRPVSLDGWMEALPSPITPLVLRGQPLDRERRRRAGLDDAFLDALEAWSPS
ncbi:MAG: DUF455 family protein [Sandaracinus sp.]|nr:DUF455 family protein [Sandaracinus sp.]